MTFGRALTMSPADACTRPLPPVRLLDLGLVDAWQTQAVYHALAEQMTDESPDTLIICRPRSPYLCLGYHQVYDAVFDRAECERRGLPVFRRRVGGGGTYLDADQLFYQCVFHHRRAPALAGAIYAQMLAAPVAALRRLGLNATLRDVNEIEIDGLRIAGTGGGRIGEASVVVGNILFDFDYETMAQVWRAPWAAFRDLAAAALRERVTTLRRLLGAVSIADVQPLLLAAFAQAFGRSLAPGALTAAEEVYARQVADRLASPSFLALHNDGAPLAPLRPLKIAAGVFIHAVESEVGGVHVRASLHVHDHQIIAARIESTPPYRWEAAASALQGAPLRSWADVVNAQIGQLQPAEPA